MKQSGTFEDLYVWRDAIGLGRDLFELFDACRVFSLRNQIERAVVSISANIAEGFELGTDKQFVKHLYIAKGSCGEVRSLLRLSQECGVFSQVQVNPLLERARRLSVMIYNLIESKGKE